MFDTSCYFFVPATSSLPLPRYAITSRPQVKNLTNVSVIPSNGPLKKYRISSAVQKVTTARCNRLITTCFMLFISIMIDHKLSCNPIGQLFLGDPAYSSGSLITHVRYIKILTLLRGFLAIFSIFGLVLFVIKSLLGIARQYGI